MMKFFNKMDKTTGRVMFAAFLWILVCNVIVLILTEPLEKIGVPGWTIWLANVLFFIKGNPNTKEALLENCLAGLFGILCALGLEAMAPWLMGLGCSGVVAFAIPIGIFLFLTIAIHPMVPYVFNNMALCFFCVSLASRSLGEFKEAGLGPWGHFLGVIIGNVIVNVGTVLICAAAGKIGQNRKGR